MSTRPKSLMTRLAALTTLGLASVLIPYGAIRLQRESALFDADTRRDHAAIAHALRAAVRSVASRGGPGAVAALIEDADLQTDRATIAWVVGDADAEHAGSEVTSRELRGDDGTDYLETRAAVPEALGTLRISEPLGERQAYLHETLLRSIGVTALLIALCLLVQLTAGYFLLHRRMAHLLDKVARIGRGDLREPLPPMGHDELGRLAEALNEMCDRLVALRGLSARESAGRAAAVEQLRHAHRLSTVGTLASGVAHELGTPLNVIQARATMIARGRVDGEAARSAADIVVGQAKRMEGIIRQLLDFVRRRPSERRPTDMHRLCAQTLGLLAQLASKRGVTLQLAPEKAPICAEVDAAQLTQVLTNLVVNGIQAQPNGGAVRVSVTCARDGETVLLEVDDDGEGMTAEVRERLFEPFFTTKGVGEGTGLGLSVAYGIVADHGGRIDLWSIPGKGSRFTVHLPIRPG